MMFLQCIKGRVTNGNSGKAACTYADSLQVWLLGFIEHSSHCHVTSSTLSCQISPLNLIPSLAVSQHEIQLSLNTCHTLVRKGV